MRRRGSVTAGALALALGGAALVVSTADAAPTPSPPGATTSRILLPTGDAVRVTSGAGGTAGAPRVAVVSRSRDGVAGHFTTTRVGESTYVIPAVAARYLGVLDRSLFEVARGSSASVTRAASADVPVTLSVQPGTSPSVPGLTVTSRTASAWRGHFTPAGTREFGAALTQQWQQDAAARRVSRTLFGGVTRMAQPGASVPVRPQFPQQTLTISALGPDGKAAQYAFVALTNVDDGRKFSNFVDVVDGVAKVSVPQGTYSGLANIDTFSRNRFTSYLVPVEETPVGGSGATMVFDARRATIVPSVQTPLPASLLGLSLEWDRTSGRGGVGASLSYEDASDVRVAPSPRVTKGRLDWLTTWQMVGGEKAGGALPYTYDLAFHDKQQVPADQDRTVAATDLARVDARYYADRPGLAVFGRGPVYPFQDFFGFFLFEQKTPQARTEYVYAPPDARWGAVYFTLGGSNEVDVDDGLRAYEPGETYSADWLRGPLGPGIAQPTPETRFFYCGYCRDATSMLIGLAPIADTTPGHFGYFFGGDEDDVLTRFRLYRDGALVENRPDSTGDLVEVPARKATYRAVVDTRRGLADLKTSTTARTELTFVSSATDGPPAPSTFGCPQGDEGEEGEAAVEPGGCTVLPVLVSEVPLPTDLLSTMPPGQVPMDFTVEHAAGAAESAITGVQVELTFDGGRSYVAMPVTETSANHYRTTLSNPTSAKGKPVGFRLTATDAAGGKIVQTAQAAYFVGQN